MDCQILEKFNESPFNKQIKGNFYSKELIGI